MLSGRASAQILLLGQNGILKVAPLSASVRSYSSTDEPRDNAGDWVDRMIFNWKPSWLISGYKWSKLICIEGNIGVGKNKFAEAVSKKFGLKNFGAADVNYDLKRRADFFKMVSDEQIEWEMKPESLAQRTLGLNVDYFCQNPEDWEHTVRLRYHMLANRNFQYSDALGHLLHTGQGCALVRHFYSDKVLADAQRAMRWFNDRPGMRDQTGMAYNYYLKTEYQINQYLLRPQVVLYLQMPAEEAYQKVQSEGNEYEKQLPLDYFRRIEEAYVDNLAEARTQGVSVIELNVSSTSTEDLLEDLDALDEVEVPFNAWQPSNTLDRKLRMLKKACYDFHLRSSLVASIYRPVEATWSPRWMQDQLSNEREFHGLWERGFDPSKNSLTFLKD